MILFFSPSFFDNWFRLLRKLKHSLSSTALSILIVFLMSPIHVLTWSSSQMQYVCQYLYICLVWKTRIWFFYLVHIGLLIQLGWLSKSETKPSYSPEFGHKLNDLFRKKMNPRPMFKKSWAFSDRGTQSSGISPVVESSSSSQRVIAVYSQRVWTEWNLTCSQRNKLVTLASLIVQCALSWLITETI